MYFCRFACLFVSSLSSHLVVGTQVLCPNLCVCLSCSCLSWQRRIPTVRGTVSSPSSGFAKSFPVFFFSIFFPGFMLVLPGFVLVLSSLPYLEKPNPCWVFTGFSPSPLMVTNMAGSDCF